MGIVAGNKILTSKGYKDIQTLSESDLVRTHLNNWKAIEKVECLTLEGMISCIVSVSTNVPIQATHDHPFLTKTMISTGFGDKDYVLSDKLSWTPAASLKAGKHLLCMPLEQIQTAVPIYIMVDSEIKEPIPIDWFMAGFFFGKGNRTMDVEFIPPGWSILREFSSNRDSSTCNHIPEWIQRLPIDYIKDFIRGFKKSTKRISGGYEVINEIVALNLQRMYAKLHRFVRIHISDSSVCLIEINDNHVSFDKHYMYIPIVRVSDKPKQSSIYNIEVADDQSYTIQGVASK